MRRMPFVSEVIGEAGFVSTESVMICLVSAMIGDWLVRVGPGKKVDW